MVIGSSTGRARSSTPRQSARSPRDREALSFVDDYHGLGIVPLDLHDLGCDLYTAGVLKWMLGGPGLVFLYARRDLLPSLEPAITGWFAQQGRSPSMRSISIITPRAPWSTARPRRPCSSSRRAGSTSSRRWDRPRSRPERRALRSRHRPGGRSGSRGAHAAGPRRPRRRREREGRARGGEIATSSWHGTSARTTAATVCQISPHFFNTEEDVDRCFDELRRLV